MTHLQLLDSQDILVEVEFLCSVHSDIAIPPGPGFLGQRDEHGRNQGKQLLSHESGRGGSANAAVEVHPNGEDTVYHCQSH